MAGTFSSRAFALATTAALAASLAACSSRKPPTADQPPPPPPDLTGLAVMVLPVQEAQDPLAGALDREIAYWLADRTQQVRWVFTPELERVAARQPGMNVRIRGLAVGSFARAEVKRIGDPLYGDLRRLGALVDTRYALLPIGAGIAAATDGQARLELSIALIDTIGGAVLWYAVIGGQSGSTSDPALIASVAQELARRLFP